MQLIAKREVAFGQGNRKPGFRFGRFKLANGERVQDLVELISGMTNRAGDSLPDGFEIAEGVSLKEVISAVRSLGRTVDILVDDDANDDGVSDWRDTAIKSLEVAKVVKSLLEKAGISTVRDLDKISDIQTDVGLSEKQENDLRSAVAALIK